MTVHPEEAPTFRELQVIAEVARLNSYRKAAKSLDTSPSRVVQTVEHVEKRLSLGRGAIFSARHHGQGVSTTTVGRKVVEAVSDVLRSIDHLRATAVLAASGSSLTFRVLSYPAHVRRFLATATAAFRTEHPTTSIVFLGLADEIRAHGGVELLRRLIHGEAELAIAPSGNRLVGPFSTHPLYEWTLVAGLQKPYRNRRIQVNSLQRRNLLLSPERFHSRELLREACIRAGFEPRVVAESSNTEVLIALGEAGVGTPILPSDAIVADNCLFWTPVIDSERRPLSGSFSLYKRELEPSNDSNELLAEGQKQLQELSTIIIHEAKAAT